MPSLQEAVFDAIPTSIFVVDRHLSVTDFNDASLALEDQVLLGMLRPSPTDIKIGQLLQCSTAAVTVCGESEACRHCGIPRAVDHALAASNTEDVYRTLTVLERQDGGQLRQTQFLTSARRFHHELKPQALLMLEDKANWAAALAP